MQAEEAPTSPEVGRTKVRCTCGAEAGSRQHASGVEQRSELSFKSDHFDSHVSEVDDQVCAKASSGQTRDVVRQARVDVTSKKSDVVRRPRVDVASEGAEVNSAAAAHARDDSIFYTVKSRTNRHKDGIEAKMAAAVKTPEHPKQSDHRAARASRPAHHGSQQAKITVKDIPRKQVTTSTARDDVRRHAHTQTSARRSEEPHYAPAETSGIAMGQSGVDLRAFRDRLEQIQAQIERDRADYLLQSPADDVTAGQAKVGNSSLLLRMPCL